MKRTTILIVGLLAMLAGVYLAFAVTPAWGRRIAPGRARPMRWQDPAWGGAMCPCPLHATMMRGMAAKQMHVTENGEVVIMIGCQLFKYDANLNLVGQTQVEVDMEAMQKKLQQMMEKCPIRQQMMEQEYEDTDENRN